MLAAVKGFGPGAFEALAALAADVSWLAKGAERDSMRQPELGIYAPVSDNESDREAFDRSYAAFAAWSTRSEIQRRLDQQRDVVAEASTRLLELSRLEKWAASSRGYPSITYAGMGIPVPEDATVTEISGAYTREAWEGLVVRLLESIDSTGTASPKARQFKDTYVDRFYDRWKSFLMDVPLTPQAIADPRTSPWVDLLETVHHNVHAPLPEDVPRPTWIAVLDEVMRTEELPQPEADEDEDETQDEEVDTTPPWRAYTNALTVIAQDAESAREDGEAAVAIATAIAARSGDSFTPAVQLAERIVPRGSDQLVGEQIESILEMPILDGASFVMDAATDPLDTVWRDRIARPHSGELTSMGIAQLYSAQGALAGFRDGELAPFYRDGRARKLIGDRTMPFGPDFLGWMRRAERLQRSLVVGGLGAGGIVPVTLSGIPHEIEGNWRMLVAQTVLSLRCNTGSQTFIYSQGGGRQTFRWSPDCTELALTLTVLEDGQRRELPSRYYRGPLAFPAFLQKARRAGERMTWRIPFRDIGATVILNYKMRGGQELLSISHARPPASIRR
jgi:hypothetical protein